MKRFILLLVFTEILRIFPFHLSAQVAITPDGSSPDNSAMLEVKSTTRGMLVPRMTAAQRDAISNPANGLLIFCTDNNQYYSNKASPADPVWVMVSSQWSNTGTDLFYTLGNVGIGTPVPHSKLDVNGIISLNDFTLRLRSGNNGDHGLQWDGSVDGPYLFGWNGGALGTIGEPHSLTWDYNGNVQVRSIFTVGGDVRIGTPAPYNSAILEITSTTRGLLPPRMTQGQRDAILSPVAGLQVFNSNTHRPNYYDGAEWMNFDGTSAKTITVGIGDSYQGGKVAYILQSGDPGYDASVQHGLIAAPSDQGTVEWGCYGTIISGAGGTALGTGNQNTLDIMAGCTEAGIAARICGDLVLNGYSDWYLPSKDELNKLYLKRVFIGGFVSQSYWSSSEYSEYPATNAGNLDFSNGEQLSTTKNYPNTVRAVRAF